MEPSNDKLRELFSRQREQDLREVPPFEAVVRSAFQGRSDHAAIRKFPLYVRLAAGFAIVLLIGIVVLQLRHRSFEKEMQQWASLSQWSAATDGFLSQSQLASNENATDSFMNLQTQTPETSSSTNL